MNTDLVGKLAAGAAASYVIYSMWKSSSSNVAWLAFWIGVAWLAVFIGTSCDPFAERCFESR
jgi:hypothetical protein